MAHSSTARVASPTIAEALAQFLAEQQHRLAPQTFAQDVTKKLAAWLAEKGCSRADEAEDATERIHDGGRDDAEPVFARGFAARIQDDCNAYEALGPRAARSAAPGGC